MSYPTKSEINQQSKKDNDVIVLNIYNSNKEYNENENNETNQTEANLKIEDNIRNYPASKPNNIINNNNNNIVFYDNTRQNQYPYSENRGVYSKDDHVNKNKFSKSFNPYKINDLSRNKNNINDVKFNEQNQNQLSNENIMIKPKENSIKFKKKKPNPFSFENLFLLRVFCIAFLPCACIWCCYLCYKRKKQKEEEEKNNN